MERAKIDDEKDEWADRKIVMTRLLQGWKDGWMGGAKDGWMDGWDGWTSSAKDVCMEGWVDMDGNSVRVKANTLLHPNTCAVCVHAHTHIHTCT